MPAGKPAKAGRSLTRSSKNLLGRLVMAEVRALPMETSAEIADAPSMRAKPSRKPPSSTTEMATAHLFLAASASHAASIFFTSVDVRHGLVRIMFPGGGVRGERTGFAGVSAAKNGLVQSDRARRPACPARRAARAGRARSST